MVSGLKLNNCRQRINGRPVSGPVGREKLVLKVESLIPLKFRVEGITILSEEFRKEGKFLYTLNLRRKPEYTRALIKFRQRS